MIDIVLVPNYDCITRTVAVDIVLRSDAPIWAHAADIALCWHPKHLALVDCDLSRATVGRTLAGIPGIPPLPLTPWDYYGVNTPIDDGTAYFMWLGPLTGSANPTLVEDDIIGTVVFELLGDAASEIRVLDEITAAWTLETAVYAGDVPGLDLAGDLGSTKVSACVGGD